MNLNIGNLGRKEQAYTIAAVKQGSNMNFSFPDANALLTIETTYPIAVHGYVCNNLTVNDTMSSKSMARISNKACKVEHHTVQILDFLSQIIRARNFRLHTVARENSVANLLVFIKNQIEEPCLYAGNFIHGPLDIPPL